MNRLPRLFVGLITVVLFASAWSSFTQPKQIVFDVSMDEAATEKMASGEEMDAEGILRMLYEHGHIRLKAEDPIKSRLLVFFVTEGGEIAGAIETDAIKLDPGETRLGSVMPGDRVIEGLEEGLEGGAFFPDSFFNPKPMDVATFESDEQMLQAVAEELDVPEGQMAIGITFLDIIGRYAEKDDVEVQISPMAMIGETEKN